MDIAKACGVDGISNKMIKLCNYGIHKPLTRLIHTSLSFGQFPHLWKLAIILSFFKRGNNHIQLSSNITPFLLK